MTGALAKALLRTPAKDGVQSACPVRRSRTSPARAAAFAGVRYNGICRGFVKVWHLQTIAPPAPCSTPAQAGVQGGTRDRRSCMALDPRLRGGATKDTRRNINGTIR